MNDVSERSLGFKTPTLAGWPWTCFEITGKAPGPRLCIMAGIHVNEVSGIEAVFRLRQLFAAKELRGTVSLMPVVNLPAVPVHAQFVCPVDGKNINFSFPGGREGSFSEALADALLNEWAADADCLVDLHGGDLCEQVSRFSVAPLTGDATFDERTMALALAFAPEILVQIPAALPPGSGGRSISGRVLQGRHAAFAEAGGNGLLDEGNVAFHVDGVLRVAGFLGMIDDAPPLPIRPPTVVDTYHWVGAGRDGWCDSLARPNQKVVAGEPLAYIRDFSGRPLHTIVAPTSGHVLWQCTHPLVKAETQIFGIGALAGALPLPLTV